MEIEKLLQKSSIYLKKLCNEIVDRSVGNEGNRKATFFFEEILSSFGWNIESQEFDAIDWENDGAFLQIKNPIEILDIPILVSPYSLGCNVQGKLISISNIKDLEKAEIKDCIILLHGEIAKEQLMPKNFVFYNPEEHQKIIALLEKGQPNAIICATGRNAELAGGVYPFPLIEDGDFNIPSVFMTEEDGIRLLGYLNKEIFLSSKSKRISGKGYNVIGKKGKQTNQRIVITAHIDAKKGTPGAIDNATGIVILLLVAEILKDYDKNNVIELVALNGEDYYAVPGQMLYINKNQNLFHEIFLNINIDGAGYKEGKSAISFYNFSEEMIQRAKQLLENFSGIVEGNQWPQGDHSIFVQYGRPAIALSSKWFTDNINCQTITHTPKDTIEIVDCNKLVEIAQAISYFVLKIL